jgi:hypothetical protein
MTRFSGFLAAVIVSATVSAADVEGYRVPERVQLEGGRAELVLNGAGVRVQSLFKVYVGALYLPARSEDGEGILRANQPSRIMLRLLRELTPEQITASMTRALHESLTPEQRAPLERRFKEFGASFETLPTLKRGAQIVIDYLPQAGTTIRVDNETIGRVAGADFNQALLRTWIGERPGDIGLKNALLGVRSMQDVRPDSRTAQIQ